MCNSWIYLPDLSISNGDLKSAIVFYLKLTIEWLKIYMIKLNYFYDATSCTLRTLRNLYLYSNNDLNMYNFNCYYTIYLGKCLKLSDVMWITQNQMINKKYAKYLVFHIKHNVLIVLVFHFKLAHRSNFAPTIFLRERIYFFIFNFIVGINAVMTKTNTKKCPIVLCKLCA